MANFAVWLHDLNEPNDPALVELKTFADNNVAKWPYWSDKPDAYLALIATTAADPDKLRLLLAAQGEQTLARGDQSQ